MQSIFFRIFFTGWLYCASRSSRVAQNVACQSLFFDRLLNLLFTLNMYHFLNCSTFLFLCAHWQMNVYYYYCYYYQVQFWKKKWVMNLIVFSFLIISSLKFFQGHWNLMLEKKMLYCKNSSNLGILSKITKIWCTFLSHYFVLSPIIMSDFGGKIKKYSELNEKFLTLISIFLSDKQTIQFFA